MVSASQARIVVRSVRAGPHDATKTAQPNMSSDEDALLDSLLKAATTSLKRKASNRERVASVEPAEEPNETAGAKRKRHDEEEPEPLQPKAVKKDKKTVVNVPSAAERAEALRREKEEKEARIQGRDKDRHAPVGSLAAYLPKSRY